MNGAFVSVLPGSGTRVDLRALQDVVDRRLSSLIATGRDATALDDALCYSLLSPGKRLRPLLTILAAWEFGPRDLRALDAGCALEMVHAASLVLDDLPVMDNAVLRRGQPATHIRFGEDVALLAVVSLLSRAYAVLGEAPELPAHTRSELVGILSQAVGSEGLSRGQLFDLRGAGRNGRADPSEVNHLKTGALFVAAVEMAAAILELRDERLTRLRCVALHLGQAFQAMDDLADEAEDGIALDEAGSAVAFIRRRERRVRLRQHMASALAELDPDGQLAHLVRGTFSDALRSAE
ncbi:MAG: polyprenyl synthetase family protein [Alphaproteobacteria bacterium]